MLKQIIESIIREDTTEQLDSAFEGITRAISLRSAQGLGTDEGLNEMLAAITAERNTRPQWLSPNKVHPVSPCSSGYKGGETKRRRAGASFGALVLPYSPSF